MQPISRILLAAALLLTAVGGSPYASDTPPEQAAEPPFAQHDALFDLYQPYMENISGYEPVYFLAGVRPEDTKFQFSLKYRFVNPEMPLAQKLPWMRGFHFSYTQTSFWDLGGDSKPFEDTSYKPEVFFLSQNLFSGRGRAHGFIQAGGEHESNGQSGDTSRSTNYAYIKPIFVYYHEKTKTGFQVAPKIWTYVANSDSTNPDLNKYRGYFDLELKIGRANRFVAETHWRWAEKGHSVSVDLSYPMDRLINVNPQVYLHVQYVNALAESLLNYTERNEALRIGFSIVR